MQGRVKDLHKWREFEQGADRSLAIVISFFSFYLRSSQVQRLALNPILSPGCPAYHLSAPSDNHISSVKPLPLPSCLLSHFLHSFIHSNVSRASTLHQHWNGVEALKIVRHGFFCPQGAHSSEKDTDPQKIITIHSGKSLRSTRLFLPYLLKEMGVNL